MKKKDGLDKQIEKMRFRLKLYRIQKGFLHFIYWMIIGLIFVALVKYIYINPEISCQKDTIKGETVYICIK